MGYDGELLADLVEAERHLERGDYGTAAWLIALIWCQEEENDIREEQLEELVQGLNELMEEGET